MVLPGVMNGRNLAVMNTELLVRSTFVLDRVTASRLDYVSRVLGRSRSDLVREVLAEPVRVMAELAGLWEKTGDVNQLQLAGLDHVEQAVTQACDRLGGSL